MNKNQEFPGTGRLGGIDYGTVRIGIAICDPDWILASPYENYNRRTPEKDFQYLKQLAEEESLRGFVIGLPVHTDGQESQKSVEARDFGIQLAQVTGLPVTYFDERYTSVFAEQILGQGGMTSKKKKKRLDMIAAQIMLTAFLESNRAGSHEVPGNLQD